MFVEARATFSLGGIKGLDPAIDKGFLDALRVHGEQIFPYSRSDVRWRGLDATSSFKDKDLYQAWFMAGAALGFIKKTSPKTWTYDYEAMGPGRPGGVLRLSNDLEDAAYMIKDNQTADLSLRKRIQETESAAGVMEIAHKIEAFVTNVATQELMLSGELVTNEKANFLAEPYVDSITGLRKALENIYPRRWTAEDYRVGEDQVSSTHPIPGYYCHCTPPIHLCALGEVPGPVCPPVEGCSNPWSVYRECLGVPS